MSGKVPMVLHFDFRQNATRRFILAELHERLDATQRLALEAAVAAAGVPEGHHHDLGEVLETVDAMVASTRVKDDMCDIYRILAQAEATAHGCTVEQTHFHEVGNGEAVRCVAAICMAVEMLDPECITATCVQTGSGTVQCAHGELPIPAPATAAILSLGIPTCDDKLDGELCTPTSAAVIKHFVDEFVV